MRDVAALLLDSDALLPPASTDERTPEDRAEDEADVLELEADDSEPDSEYMQRQTLSARSLSKLKYYLSRELRDFLRIVRRTTRDSVTSTHSGEEGDLAHRVIQAHYLMAHPNDEVLIDSNVRISAGVFTKLTAVNGPIWNSIRAALSVVNGISEPDILNATKYVVYEIKPLNELMGGVVQLWKRYLIPLNAASAVAAGFNKVVVGSWTRSILWNGSPTASSPWPAPWLPGVEWTPAPAYVLPDGEVVMAGLAAPGIIVYQYARTDLERQAVPVKVSQKELAPRGKRRELLSSYMVAILLVSASLRTRTSSTAGDAATRLADTAALAAAFQALSPGISSTDGAAVSVTAVLIVLGSLTAAIGVAAVVLYVGEALAASLTMAQVIDALVALASGTLAASGRAMTLPSQ